MVELNWFELVGRFGVSKVVRTRAEMHAWIDEYFDRVEENPTPGERYERLTIDASVAQEERPNGHDNTPEEDVAYWRSLAEMKPVRIEAEDA